MKLKNSIDIALIVSFLFMMATCTLIMPITYVYNIGILFGVYFGMSMIFIWFISDAAKGKK